MAHNGSIIPVPGRDIMVQGWYQGGVSVFDFTDSAHPVEIAFFDRGPLDAAQLITGGYWSTYWYNGYIYGTEIARGLDIFRLTSSAHLSQNEIDAAMMVRIEAFNAQQQPTHHLAGQLRRGARVSRSAHAQQGDPAGARVRREGRARRVWTRCEPVASEMPPPASNDSTRWRRSWRTMPRRRARDADRMRLSPRR